MHGTDRPRAGNSASNRAPFNPRGPDDGGRHFPVTLSLTRLVDIRDSRADGGNLSDAGGPFTGRGRVLVVDQELGSGEGRHGGCTLKGSLESLDGNGGPIGGPG